MRKHIFALTASSALACLALAPLPAFADGGAMARAWSPSVVPTGLSVASGSAPIEQALSTIIPAPYHIALDESVPSSAVIVWPAGNDWMKVLRAAVAPLDLYVEPDWSNNTVRIVRLHENAYAASNSDMQRMPAPERSTAGVNPHGFQPLPQLRPGALPVTETTQATTYATAGTSAVPPVTVARSATTTSTTTSTTAGAAKPVFNGSYVIPAGTMLSKGLADYVKRFGWSIRWNIKEDYLLDAPFPIPAGGVTSGITYVMRAYQSQGGLLGNVPMFATPNRVVVIEPTSTRGN
jgi:hypothetical protein